MTKFFTCEDCRYYDETTRSMSTCNWDGKCHDGTDEFCPYFQTKDGEIPRYCRMAQDIDRMAEEMLTFGYDQTGCEGWAFMGELYFRKDKAIEAAKSWLMELEDGNES